MSNENIKSISSIKRHIDGSPTFIDSPIEEGCTFENSIIEGYGTIIIDKDFIDEILSTINESDLSNKFTELLFYINNKVNNYFYSSETNSNSRQDIYDKYGVVNDEGMVIGTKLSSLKGKNVALCSEKSIGVFIILESLYRKGKMNRKPSMILSTLRTENTPSEPHAFILIDKEQDNYPTRHLLYDIQNPTLLEDKLGNKLYSLGIYTLSDEQHQNIMNGVECTPLSLFEVMRQELHDIGDKRIYGSVKLDKSL